MCCHGRQAGAAAPCPRREALRWLWTAALFAGLALAVAACDREGGRLGPRDVPAMAFQVDESLLGPPVTEPGLGIVFRPPAGWAPADPAMHRDLRRQVEVERRPGDPLATDPVLLFGIAETPAVCKVGRFFEPPAEGLTRAWIARCLEEMRRQVPAEVHEDLYAIGGEVVAAQFLAQNSQMVLFRIICQGRTGEPVMVDYVMPRTLYAQQVRAVESSIGSVRME